MEEELKATGKELGALDLAEMDAVWEAGQTPVAAPDERSSSLRDGLAAAEQSFRER